MAGIKGRVNKNLKALKNLEALQKRATEISDLYVKVGVFGGQHGQVSNVDIATFHEFGTTTIPARSFIRSSIDENREKIKDNQKKLARLSVLGKITAEKALEILGMLMQSNVVNKIRSNIPPPLKNKTIQRKGSSIALIDTGQLVQSIAYKIVPIKRRLLKKVE